MKRIIIFSLVWLLALCAMAANATDSLGATPQLADSTTADSLAETGEAPFVTHKELHDSISAVAVRTDKVESHATAISAAVFAVAAVALVLALLALVKAGKATKQIARMARKLGDAGAAESSERNSLNRQVGSLQEQYSQLAEAVKILQSAPQPSAPCTDQPAVAPRRQERAAKTLYASRVRTTGFEVGTLTESPNSHTMAVLTVSGSEGTFVVNDAPNVQSCLLQTFDMSVSQIADIIDRSGLPMRIVTVTPGRIRLEGPNWVVTTKAQVRLD